jgi:hypothetical protein
MLRQVAGHTFVGNQLPKISFHDGEMEMILTV